MLRNKRIAKLFYKDIDINLKKNFNLNQLHRVQNGLGLKIM